MPTATRTSPFSAIAICLTLAAVGSARGEDLSMASGHDLYRRFCESCHGASGLGDGPSARHFKSDTPDLTRISTRHGGRFPHRWVTRIVDGTNPRQPHGPKDMPAWGKELAMIDSPGPGVAAPTQERIQRLVDYLESIQRP